MDSTRLAVTWIIPFVPFPPEHGGAVRIYNLLRHLARHCDIDLFALTDQMPSDAHLAVLEKTCRSVQVFARQPTGPRPVRLRLVPPAVILDDVPAMHAALAASARSAQPNHIFQVDYPSLAQYLVHKGQATPVLTELDVTYLTLLRRARVEKNWLIKLRRLVASALFYAYEMRHLPRFDAVIAMSEHDRDELDQRLPGLNVISIPNGVDCAHFQFVPATPPGERLLFLGNFNHPPNVDAVLYFVEKVWPGLAARQPDLELMIVGADPPAQIVDRAEQHIHVLGRVDDVQVCYAQARALVVPMRFGSGTRLKILEAFAAGTPVISTALGMEGLDALPEQHYLAADSPEAFHRQIERLLTEPSLGEMLSQHARALVETHYDWQILADQQLTLYHRLLASPPTGH